MKKNWAYTAYWTIIKFARTNKFTRLFVDTLAYVYYKLFRSDKQYVFNKRKFHYFYHLYNRTVASERVVEIPQAFDLLKRYEGKDILEVGNVMAHYTDIHHDVLDKYEKGKNVINKDVVSYKSPNKYDLIFSISTMEHVGYSYGEKKEKDKFKDSTSNLKKLLKKGGVLYVTFPVYYNEFITDLVLKDKMPFTKEYFMVRTSFWNEWKQVSRKEALKGGAYDKYYANANVLYVGTYSKS